MIPLLLIVALILAAGGGSSSSSGGGSWNAPAQQGLNELRALCARAGLSEQHTAFLALVARGESGFNNLRGLGIPERFPAGTIPTNAGQIGVNEARAAEAAFRQNRERFAACPWPESAYGFGSGGWFAFLPAYGLAQLPAGSGLRCLPPSAVFDPIASVCMAIGFARGLQNYGGFTRIPTVLNLRGGWGWPGGMGRPDRLAKIRGYYQKQAVGIGLPAGFVDQQIPRFPGIDLGELYHRLGGTAPAVLAAMPEPAQPAAFVTHETNLADLFERLEAA